MQQARPTKLLQSLLTSGLWHGATGGVAALAETQATLSSTAVGRLAGLQGAVLEPLCKASVRISTWPALHHGAAHALHHGSSPSVRLLSSCSKSSQPHFIRTMAALESQQLHSGWQQSGSPAHLLRHMSSQAHQPKKPMKLSDMVMYGAAAAIGMIGCTWAAVPLYRVFCAATGYGGTAITGSTVEEKLKRRQENPDPEVEKAAAQREITVWFNADVADDMPWTFKPTQECVRVKPGQSTLAFFTAHNKSDKPITGYSVYSVAPDKAAQYFNKIQCFCFEEQRLRAGETVDMPVFFYLDPELVQDWNFRNIHDVTLSYVFHKVDDEDLEDLDDDDEGSFGVKLHGPGLAPLPAGTAAAILAGAGAGQGNPMPAVGQAGSEPKPPGPATPSS